MLRFLTAGESHGPQLNAILEGLPAGLPLAHADIDADLARRQIGYGSGGRMNIEKDAVQITSGVSAGQTTGGPVAMTVLNRDYKNWAEKDIAPMTIPRPGHADLTGAIKYGYQDLRLGLERASARETTMRVAVGAICKKLLAQFGVQVYGYVAAIGGIEAHLDPEMGYAERFRRAESDSSVRCPDPLATEKIEEAIRQVKIDKDTLGGIIEVAVVGLPPGLGSHVHYDRRLTGLLLAAVGSIQSMKGAEVGSAYDNAGKRGTQVHDELYMDAAGFIRRKTNRAGGLEGGMTTGEPLVVRAFMKPISTTLTPIHSVDLANSESSGTTYERSDFCATPRAVPIVEGVIAFVMANALLEKLGGDSLGEMLPRFEQLRRSRPDDLPMWNEPWRFEYEIAP
jgi:chorismate synthase